MADPRPRKTTTFLMFDGKAEEAMGFYTSIFDDAEVMSRMKYGPEDPGAERTFTLAGQQYTAMDSAVEPPSILAMCRMRLRGGNRPSVRGAVG